MVVQVEWMFVFQEELGAWVRVMELAAAAAAATADRSGRVGRVLSTHGSVRAHTPRLI